MSLNDRVSSRSSSTSGEKRRVHRRDEGARGSGARTPRSPWPRRRAASVRRSSGREIRRARGRVAAATTSRMAVTASTGHRRRGPPNRRGVAPSSVPTMALVCGSRTGAAARHVGCESTTTVPARTVAACLSESGGSARPDRRDDAPVEIAHHHVDVEIGVELAQPLGEAGSIAEALAGQGGHVAHHPLRRLAHEGAARAHREHEAAPRAPPRPGHPGSAGRCGSGGAPSLSAIPGSARSRRRAPS